jgi:hypothetical protein
MSSNENYFYTGSRGNGKGSVPEKPEKTGFFPEKTP